MSSRGRTNPGLVSEQLAAVGQRIQQGQDFLRTRMTSGMRGADTETTSPTEQLLRLDTLENSRKAALDKLERTAFFGEQTSQAITNLCSDIEDELEKNRTYNVHPERIQRQIIEVQNQAQTMQVSTRECDSELRRVYADVANLLEHATLQRSSTNQRRAPQKPSSARDVVQATVTLITWVSHVIGRVTMSAARRAGFLSADRTRPNTFLARVPFGQQQSISSLDDDQRKCIECVDDMRQWWEQVGVFPTQLANLRTKPALQELRERWAAKDRDLKVFTEKLAVLMNRNTSHTTREVAMKNRQALGLPTVDVLG